MFFLYFGSFFFFQIFRWFWHFTKICITCITFQQIWALCDVWLPNWMIYYSTKEHVLEKIHFHVSLHHYHSIHLQFFPVRILFFLIKMLAAHAWAFIQLKFIRIPNYQIITQSSKQEKIQETTSHMERRIVCPKFNLSKLWFQLMLPIKQFEQ